MSLHVIRPSGELAYTYDWADQVPAGVTITAVEHTLPSPLVREAQAFDASAKTSTVRLSGAVHGQVYDCAAVATLNNGELVPGAFTLRGFNG